MRMMFTGVVIHSVLLISYLTVCFIRYNSNLWLLILLAAELAWNDLITKKPWKGFNNQSITQSIALESIPDCDAFADKLLNDSTLTKAIRRNHRDNDSFIQEVLRRWYHKEGVAVPCTWEKLIYCMNSTLQNTRMIEIIEDNVFSK